ncbi:MAG: TIGR03435 family protein, partial [Vicinamibacterales bacterium]
ASVKVNASGSGSSFTRRLPGGTFLASNMTIHDMIAFAHGLQPFQVEGAPDWAREVRFDITIKTETNVGPVAIGPTQIGLQLARAVLAERFAFRAHRETRERPVFALVRARTEGALGPRLRQSKTDCTALAREAGTTGAPWPPRSAEGRILCGLQMQGDTLTAGGYPMPEFQRYLTGQTQRAVIDRTGLAGGWDFELTFAPADLAPDAAAERNIPSLFTALQEQLGLKLDATRGPAEVLVVDRVERPTAD